MKKKLKKGIGGLLFILVTAIGTFMLSTIVDLSTTNNVRYIVNSTAYFVSNKAAVNLYNTDSESGTYTNEVPRILKSNYNLNSDFQGILTQSYENRIASYPGSIRVHWDKNNSTAEVWFDPVTLRNGKTVVIDTQKIIIEK